jgi:hypothetical protein
MVLTSGSVRETQPMAARFAGHVMAALWDVGDVTH